MEKVVLVDEVGVEEEFELLATFGLDGYDYAVLMPLNQLGEEACILRIEYDDEGKMILLGIEDDEELKDAVLVYESIVKENMQ